MAPPSCPSCLCEASLVPVPAAAAAAEWHGLKSTVLCTASLVCHLCVMPGAVRLTSFCHNGSDSYSCDLTCLPSPPPRVPLESPSLLQTCLILNPAPCTLYTLQKFTPESVAFQAKILARSGLGDETSLPPGLAQQPPATSMSDARWEFEQVCRCTYNT